MESKLREEIEKLEHEEELQIKIIKEKFASLRGELKKQCSHKYDNGETALILAGYPWHTGWDKCLICGSYIETNEYGRGEYHKVVYDSDMGHWDGLTRGQTYVVIDETETQYKVKNDLGATSTIGKSKFFDA